MGKGKHSVLNVEKIVIGNTIYTECRHDMGNGICLEFTQFYMVLLRKSSWDVPFSPHFTQQSRTECETAKNFP